MALLTVASWLHDQSQRFHQYYVGVVDQGGGKVCVWGGHEQQF